MLTIEIERRRAPSKANRKIHLIQINCCALTNSFSFCAVVVVLLLSLSLFLLLAACLLVRLMIFSHSDSFMWFAFWRRSLFYFTLFYTVLMGPSLFFILFLDVHWFLLICLWCAGWSHLSYGSFFSNCPFILKNSEIRANIYWLIVAVLSVHQWHSAIKCEAFSSNLKAKA